MEFGMFHQFPVVRGGSESDAPAPMTIASAIASS